ncbi:MAG TPA: type II secretion system protein [Coxiellaceae bacterium]|nr:type II secretion system protein [Coxiellaceae bacterium]
MKIETKTNAKNFQAGFTLIELMISIAVVGFLSTIVIMNFRVGEKQKLLTYAADSVINAVRNAQNYALTSKQIPASTCLIGGASDKAAANYRVQINTSQNYLTLSAQDKCNTVYTLETYTLPRNVKFRSNGLGLFNSSGPTNNNTLQIRYTTPFASATAATTIGPSDVFTGFQSASIALELSDASKVKFVNVDGISGRVQ